MKIHYETWTITFQSYWVQSLGIIILKVKVNIRKTDRSRNWTTIWPPGGLICPRKQRKNIHRNKQQLLRGIKSYPEVSTCSKPRLYQNTDMSQNWTTIWPTWGLIHPQKQWNYFPGNKQQLLRGIKCKSEVSSCPKPKLYQGNSPGDETQSDLSEVSYLIGNNEITSSKINNNFLETLSLILRYQYAKNKGYIKNTDKSRIWTTIWSPADNILRNKQQFPGGTQSNTEVSSCSKPRLFKNADKSRNWTTICSHAGIIHPWKKWKYIIRNKQKLPIGIKSNPEVSSCSRPRSCQKNRQVLELNDNPTSWRYYTSSNTIWIHSQEYTTSSMRCPVQSWVIIMLKTKIMSRKTDESQNWVKIWPPAGIIHPKKQWRYILKNKQQLPRGK